MTHVSSACGRVLLPGFIAIACKAGGNASKTAIINAGRSFVIAVFEELPQKKQPALQATIATAFAREICLKLF